MACLIAGLIASGCGDSILAQTSARHGFLGLGFQQDQSLVLTLGGVTPATYRSLFDIYVLEWSTNLVEWSRLPTVLRTNSDPNPVVVIEKSMVNVGSGFYRTYTNSLVTPFPKPTGPYSVGTFSRLFTDLARTNRYSIRTNSSFMVQFWYPAEAAVGLLPTVWLSDAVAQDAGQALQSLYSVSENLRPLVEHALPSAPMSSGMAKFPVLIYSHSEDGTRTDVTDKNEELASNGYVVVAIDHAHVRISQFPDGRIVHGTDAYGPGMFTNDLADVRFMLDQVSGMNLSDPIFANRLDLEQVGTFGWSYGAGVAAEMGRTDDRIKAVALLNADLSQASELKRLGLRKPFVCINGTVNSGNTGWLTDTTTLFNQATTDAYEFQIKGVDDLGFAFFPWLLASPVPRTNAVLIAQSVRIFFDSYLKHSSQSLKDLPGQFPQISNFHVKLAVPD